ncbi:6-methylpretetramide 4-monooxygenase [Apiospora aurea]|uniref:6-methylpretetramide 4-monooxygenase n=1 Tax=Apiospora aurea TaxID=335848 RepID=A0ABR1PZM8_9PEZI
MAQTTTDVLIIGSGPTGTTMALELAAQGIPFRIVERNARLSDKSKALAVQPRSLELMSRHGPVERLTERGTLGLGGAVFVNGKKTVDVDLGGIRATRDSAFPHTVLVPQSETEHFLADCLFTRYGFSIEFGTEATSIKQYADGVTVTLRKVSSPPSSSASSTQHGVVGNNEAQDVETVRARYVVGGDGAHSVVRHAAAVAYEGDAYPHDFILCDAHLRNSSMPRDRFRICMRYGLMLVFPLGGDVVRLVASRPGEPATDQPVLRDFQDWLEYMVPGGKAGELFDPIWLSRFKLHHRVATNYRDGRLLLAGDAAHIHSPAGGQGMNTGIQDSVNLGWKLARVLRDEQPDAFLDSYNEERRPIGLRILATSDWLFGLAASQSWLWLFFRNLLIPWVLPYLLGEETRRTNAFYFVSQLGIRYRRSSIVGTAEGFSGPVLGGDRAPDGPVVEFEEEGEEEQKKQQKRLHQLLVPNKHHLVLFSGVTPSGAESRDDLEHAAETFHDENSGAAALVHIMTARPLSGGAKSSSSSGSFYLDADGVLHQRYGFEDVAGYAYVRPDGHVAHIGPLSALPLFMKWLM